MACLAAEHFSFFSAWKCRFSCFQNILVQLHWSRVLPQTSFSCRRCWLDFLLSHRDQAVHSETSIFPSYDFSYFFMNSYRHTFYIHKSIQNLSFSMHPSFINSKCLKMYEKLSVTNICAIQQLPAGGQSLMQSSVHHIPPDHSLILLFSLLNLPLNNSSK